MGGNVIATYAVLAQFIDKGIVVMKNTPQRARRVEEMARSFGPGQYDIVAIVDAKSDQARTAFGLTPSSVGNVRTQTPRVFNKSEFGSIIGKLP